MTYRLTRTSYTPQGTFGVLHDAKGYPLCLTLEEPWKDNQQKISCIPVGVYRCVTHNGSKFKNVWRLENVKDREAVLIHAGNTLDDTEGCILVGARFGMVNGKRAVLDSKNTLNQLRGLLPEEFDLDITDFYNQQ